eukprot:CAMPEP_0175960976 /NCGR_PEP_ID=MMETSP0108-20121206/35670_1 /TAXON_ID=195067 ORGANISM="Goniomonas pacifica, Strain CCMP1869" /NCGR_SAMPLE_ID=MMETSP0108 /ASSEMBLY_ACC=CAM_ASM_000204 /LENGTH=74 /DNA_ID=CAMNT_0017288637 /DNA_START=211 /DNA_END=435 /DNA_ORIENTATION=-
MGGSIHGITWILPLTLFGSENQFTRRPLTPGAVSRTPVAAVEQRDTKPVRSSGSPSQTTSSFSPISLHADGYWA